VTDPPSQSSLFDFPSASVVADAFDPARLTQARLLAGMTKLEVSEHLGCRLPRSASTRQASRRHALTISSG
jgi:hypothetical protein